MWVKTNDCLRYTYALIEHKHHKNSTFQGFCFKKLMPNPDMVIYALTLSIFVLPSILELSLLLIS